MSARVLSSTESQEILGKSEPTTAKRPRGRPRKIVTTTELVPQASTREEVQQQIEMASDMAALNLARQVQIVGTNMSENTILDDNNKASKPFTIALDQRDKAAIADLEREGGPKLIENIRFKALEAQVKALLDTINTSTQLSSAERGALLEKVVDMTTAINDSSTVKEVENISEMLGAINDTLEEVADNTKKKSKEPKEPKEKPAKLANWVTFKKDLGRGFYPQIKKDGDTHNYNIEDSGIKLSKDRRENAIVLDDGDKKTFHIEQGFSSVMTALDGESLIDADSAPETIALARYLISKGIIDPSQLPSSIKPEEEEDDEEHFSTKGEDEEQSSAPADPADIGTGHGTSTEPQYYIGKTDFANGYIKIYKSQDPKRKRKATRPKAVFTAPLSPDLVYLLSDKKLVLTKTYDPAAVKAFKEIYNWIGESMKIGEQSGRWALIHGKPTPKSKSKVITVPKSVPEMANTLLKNINSIQAGNTNEALKQQSEVLVDQLLRAHIIDEDDARGYLNDIRRT